MMGRGFGKALVQRANRGALLRRNRDMHRIARAQPSPILVGEPRRGQ
jgi:hypothetical protein